MANEKRLIDVDGFKNAFHTSTKPEDIEICFHKGRVFVAFDAVKRAIDNAPTVDAVPVVHGRWEIIMDDYDCEMMMCSACRSEFYDGDNDTVDHLHNYCPNCGAKMDGGNEDV